MKVKRNVSTIAVIAMGLIFVCGVQTTLGSSSTRNDTTSKGLKTVTNDSGDPVCAATGEYYFHKKLFDLGGMIPLDNRLYYGSLYWPFMSGAGNLPFRFSGSHKPILLTDIQDLTIASDGNAYFTVTGFGVSSN